MADETLPRWSLPAVNFLTVDAEAIESSILTTYEKVAGRSLAQGDPVRLFLLSVASEIINLRNEVNIAAQSNLISYARGAFLDSLGAYFAVTRLPAAQAKTTLRFTLSTALSTDYTISAGTIVTNGTVSFATDEECIIAAGSLTADAAATCTEAGAVGNDYAAGQIATLVEPLAYVRSAENITTTADGADEESDASLADRIRLAPNAFSVAGPRKAYIFHAKSVSSAVIDVSVESPTPGLVNIYLLAKGGAMPSDELLSDAQDYLSGDDIRPLTDEVHVYAPEAVSYMIHVDYYIHSDDRARAADIRTAVTTAVEEYRQWQSLTIGRDINPAKLVQKIVDAGAIRVEMSTLRPSAYVTVKPSQVAVCSGVELNYKGLSDE